MSFGDLFKFEGFNFRDMLGKIKDDPERLLLGAGDPWSTKLWNKVLDKEWEPIVDQMGGPYGGHTISAFGNKDGGVYKRAEDAGIDTGTGGAGHDIAHVVAAMMAGNYGMGKLGFGGSGSSASGQQQPGWQRFTQQRPPMQQQGQPQGEPRESVIRALLEAELQRSLGMYP